MQVIQDLFLIKVKWVTVEMKCDVRQTAGIVGKSTLAFAGELDGTLEFLVEYCKLWNGNNGPFNEGFTFFS